jgi:hypothetical protein
MSLLSKGYFPRELPPVFTTSEFGAHSEKIIADWEQSSVFKIKGAKKFAKIDGKRFRGRYSYEGVPHADPEVLSKPKKLYERRNIHITHPVPQALLADEMARNWPQIQKWLSRQTYSEDELRIGGQFDRAIKGINFAVHRAKTSYLEASSDWLVKTDISRFYPTIYTHSISWAAYGKNSVKAKLKTYEGSLGDRLDLLVRSCNRNQTIGIPVGPETSRIIAEIISSRIDFDFQSQLPGTQNETVDRLQDDWTVGAKSLDQAENILSVISKCYREYGLEINGSKTSVTHLLATKQESWQSEISAFLSHRRGPVSGTRLREFLSLCIRLQLKTPSEAVLNYALAIVERMRFGKRDIEIVESFMLRAAAISPASMDRICRIILNIEFEVGGISKKRFSARFLGLAERHIENGSLYEVLWLLYTLRGLKIPFNSRRLLDFAEDFPSSTLRLLLLDMGQLGLSVKSLPKAYWASQITEERVSSDWTWLYAYESIRKGWLPDHNGVLARPFFKAMADRDVTFYDPKKNVMRSKVMNRLSADRIRTQSAEVAELISLLRGASSKISRFSLDY